MKITKTFKSGNAEYSVEVEDVTKESVNETLEYLESVGDAIATKDINPMPTQIQPSQPRSGGYNNSGYNRGGGSGKRAHPTDRQINAIKNVCKRNDSAAQELSCMIGDKPIDDLEENDLTWEQGKKILDTYMGDSGKYRRRN